MSQNSILSHKLVFYSNIKNIYIGTIVFISDNLKSKMFSIYISYIVKLYIYYIYLFIYKYNYFRCIGTNMHIECFGKRSNFNESFKCLLFFKFFKFSIHSFCNFVDISN